MKKSLFRAFGRAANQNLCRTKKEKKNYINDNLMEIFESFIHEQNSTCGHLM